MRKLIFLCLILTGIVLSSCEWRKYESGPTISVVTPRERVTNTWRWKLAIEDGENLTGILKDSTITFATDQTLRICGPDGGCRDGKWDLVRRNTKLNLIFGETANALDIEFLTLGEMWLRGTTSDSTLSLEWDLVPADSE
ncbi:MAG: hypothetical protein AAFY71_20945 [Bacteroidota bacterium]